MQDGTRAYLPDGWGTVVTWASNGPETSDFVPRVFLDSESKSTTRQSECVLLRVSWVTYKMETFSGPSGWALSGFSTAVSAVCLHTGALHRLLWVPFYLKRSHVKFRVGLVMMLSFCSPERRGEAIESATECLHFSEAIGAAPIHSRTETVLVLAVNRSHRCGDHCSEQSKYSFKDRSRLKSIKKSISMLSRYSFDRDRSMRNDSPGEYSSEA